MAISRRHLTEDEHVVVSTRTHVKAMLLPAALLILVAAVAGFLASMPNGPERPLLQVVIGLVALALALWWVGRPFLRWMTTTYTVTNRRLITRTGVLSRRGRDIPLNRVTDVAYERGVWDRLLGCGTLVISDASEEGRVRLHDIPHVERVHLRMSELLHDVSGHDDGREREALDDGT